MNHRQRVVNGVRVGLWGQGGDALARRLAGDLDRGAGDVRHVEANHDGTATIWFEGGDDDDDTVATHHRAPDAWELVEISAFGDGTIAVTVEPET